MFKRRHEAAATVAITIDGAPHEARAGDSVAAALLAAGAGHLRTTAVTGARRAPYCMMGVCFDCMITLQDGRVEQACQTYAEDGIRLYLPVNSADRAV